MHTQAKTVPMTRHTRRAVTLVELIAAIIVLSVAIPASVLMLRDQQARTYDPLMASRATWLAEEKMEQILADRASAELGFSYILEGNYPDESSGMLHDGFTRTVEVGSISGALVTDTGGYKLVTVQVSWYDAQNVLRSVRISTVLTDLLEEMGS